jgi:hypothetical protein
MLSYSLIYLDKEIEASVSKQASFSWANLVLAQVQQSSPSKHSKNRFNPILNL